jgi:hypothetical protein
MEYSTGNMWCGRFGSVREQKMGGRLSMKNGNPLAGILNIDRMRPVRRALFFAMMIALGSGTSGHAAEADYPLDVSIVNLIATPERYDHKLVRVAGYITISYLDTIWLHQEDYENRLGSNGVLMVMEDEQIEALKGCDKTYGVIVARFLKAKTGPDGLLDLAPLSLEQWKLIHCPIVKAP